MPKIKNALLANTTAGISVESVKFDAEGIGEIKSPEIYAEVIKLANFFPVEDDQPIDEPIDTVQSEASEVGEGDLSEEPKAPAKPKSTNKKK